MIANEAREIVGGLDQPRKLSGFTETPCNPNDTRGSRRHLIRIIIAFAAVYLIWGSTFLGIRVAIHSIPPLLMAGVRWLCAGALLYSFLRWRGAPRPSGRDWMTAALIGGGIIFGGNGSVTYAEQFMPSGTVAVILAMVPALMALMGWLSGTTSKPRLAVWLGIGLATGGVAVIVRPAQGALSSQQGLGIFILLIGELMWSAASLYAVRTLYCAGQIPIDPETGEIVRGGIVPQTKRALDNLCAVLQAAGLTPEDVVRTTVFLSEMDDYAAMNEVYASFFPSAPPARTTVEAGALPRGARIEVDAVAVQQESAA